MIGYEAIDVLHEALKDTPFWKFVQPLFGEADVFEMKASAVADGVPATNTEGGDGYYEVVTASEMFEPIIPLELWEGSQKEYLGELQRIAGDDLSALVRWYSEHEGKIVSISSLEQITTETGLKDEIRSYQNLIREMKNERSPSGEDLKKFYNKIISLRSSAMTGGNA